MRLLRVAALLLLVGATAEAQEPRRDRRPRPDTARVGAEAARAAGAADTAAADTLKRDLVVWAPSDSVLAELLERGGYTATRYQAATVVFRAADRSILLVDSAAVQRGAAILVSDTILYDDSAKTVYARGDTSILRDPTQGAADLIAGGITYQIERRAGVVTNFSTALEATGERWYVWGAHGATFLSDTTRAQLAAQYLLQGELTSCNLAEPHYHFASREIKVVAKNTLVARPAVLYIADIPVAWLPFIFQDLRDGRRSGILTPRFGVSDIVRNSPSYRRHVENVGYYFAISDYMDAQLSMDWRSGARGTSFDPGWTRYTGEWRYRWLNRFLSGRFGASHLSQRDGTTASQMSWSHNQQFSQTSSLAADLNYSTNTAVQRRTTFNPYQTLATIQSRVNYQQQIGPASLALGGSRKQFPGRRQVDQNFPSLSISTRPITLAPWLVWTPSLSVRNDQRFRIDQPSRVGFSFVVTPGGAVDSVPLRRDARQTSLSFDTPLRIFDFTWRNSVTVSDALNDFPDVVTIASPRDTSTRTRVFARTYLTSVDWRTGISLPSISQGRWNISPSVNIENVDPSAGFLVRSHFTGADFVAQSKRLSYGLSASPTFFGLLPGIGPFARFRHAVSPTFSYSYAPAAKVSDEFLAATNRSRRGYLGALTQSQLSLGLATNLEAKWRGAPDDTADAARKVKLLSLTFSSLGYDFVRADTAATGITTSTFSYSARSDLLPGFDLRVGYSLFRGDPISDTARFDPFRTNVSASFSFDRETNPFVAFARVFGIAVPRGEPLLEGGPEVTEADVAAQRVAQQPVAGTSPQPGERVPTSGRGWSASFTFSSSRQRPITGPNVVTVDPVERECGNITDPQLYELCRDEVERRQLGGGGIGDHDAVGDILRGGQVFRSPPVTSLQSSLIFNLTPRWAAQWQTSYDLERSEFAGHILNLRRSLHDWTAVFGFSQSPNGNTAFNFYISLDAEPDIKFDYDRRSYRRSR